MNRHNNYVYDVPDRIKIRVIISADCRCEIDDQYAIVHHLLTPKFMVRGLIGCQFNRPSKRTFQWWEDGSTARESMYELQNVLQLMGYEKDDYPVAEGSGYPLQDEATPRDSQGARLIIEEAMKEDSHPLYVVCQGALTDIASAVLIEPEICHRLTVVWIGGAAYPKGGWEYNLFQDVAAVNVIMQSPVPLWQIPFDAYTQLDVGFAQLQRRVYPRGKIGKYLFEQTVLLSHKFAPTGWGSGETWFFGDSAGVYVLLCRQDKEEDFEYRQAPRISYEDMGYLFEEGRKQIRVYKNIDARLLFEDFYSKLEINYPE